MYIKHYPIYLKSFNMHTDKSLRRDQMFEYSLYRTNAKIRIKECEQLPSFVIQLSYSRQTVKGPTAPWHSKEFITLGLKIVMIAFAEFPSTTCEPRHEKTCYAICEQQRRRSACASAQSDQRLCCSLLG